MSRSPASLILASTCVLVLAGCATAPKPLQGEFAQSQPMDVGSSGRIGDEVRWGGEIVAVETLADRSCFELLGKPLSDSARPRQKDESAGRFIACRAGFYDPALFEVGREMTVVGRVEGIEPRRIGEFEYRYPKVAADVLYLWPEREPYPHGRMWITHPGYPWSGVWAPIYLPPRYRRP